MSPLIIPETPSSTNKWWVKCPLRPDLNSPFHVRSYKSQQRPGRSGAFQPLGSASPIVVQDTRSTTTSDLILRLDTAVEQDQLDALVDISAVLLIQGPPGSDDPGYVVVTNHSRERIMDNTSGVPSFDTLSLLGVAVPVGEVALSVWP